MPTTPHKPAFTPDDLSAAPRALFSEARQVRFQDVDAAGIAFYPRVLEYFSDAYVGMLIARGIDLPSLLARQAFRMPLLHAEADYFAPLRFGDAINVDVVAVRLGGSSFNIGYRVRAPSGRIASVGQTVHVCVDGEAFRPCPIPEELRAALKG